MLNSFSFGGLRGKISLRDFLDKHPSNIIPWVIAGDPGKSGSADFKEGKHRLYLNSTMVLGQNIQNINEYGS